MNGRFSPWTFHKEGLGRVQVVLFDVAPNGRSLCICEREEVSAAVPAVPAFAVVGKVDNVGRTGAVMDPVLHFVCADQRVFLFDSQNPSLPSILLWQEFFSSQAFPLRASPVPDAPRYSRL